MDFDPQQISFAEVVDVFWQSHNPLSNMRYPQYMSAIWYHDEAQREVINAVKAAIEKRLQAKVETPVVPLDVFYLAEDYHQKYRLQGSPLRTPFQAMYPEFSDFNNSTAAARLNGLLAGYGTQQLFDEERHEYGIPAEELNPFVRLRGGGTAGCGL